MKNKYHILAFIAISLITLYIAGCGSDDEVTEPENSSPVVDVFVIPTEFSPGEVIEFRVIAFDTDDDPLTFKWEVDAGKLNETTGTKVKWTAPEDDENVESVKVTVIVSDGISPATKRAKRTKNINFIQPDPVEKPFDPNPDPPLNAIVPGIGAAGIKLGDPFKKVETLYGKPDNPLGVGRFFSYWEQNIGFSGFVDGTNLVSSLFLERPNKAKTIGGNGIGSKLERVEQEFGKAQEVDNDGVGGKRHWYWKTGIEFTYTEDEKVEDIYIFKPIGAAPQAVEIPLQHQQKLNKAAVESLRHRKTGPTQSGN